MDLIKAKLDAKRSVDRLRSTWLATKIMLEHAERNQMHNTMAKYAQQEKRQRIAMEAAQAVYDELNGAVSPQVDIEDVVTSPDGGTSELQLKPSRKAR